MFEAFLVLAFLFGFTICALGAVTIVLSVIGGICCRLMRFSFDKSFFEFRKQFSKPYLKKSGVDGLAKPILEVPQGKFGIIVGKGTVATGHVLQCTLLVGKCTDLQIAFICHTDTAYSAKGVADLIKQLDYEVANHPEFNGSPAEFECDIVGSRKYWIYPMWTRKAVDRFINSTQSKYAKLNITRWPFVRLGSRRFSLSINAETGDYGSYKKNATERRGLSEALKPVKQVEL